MDYTKDCETQFSPLQLVEDYNSQNIDPENGKNLYWGDKLYDQENVQFSHDDYPSTDDEDDPAIKTKNYPGPSLNFGSQIQKRIPRRK